VKLTPSLNDVMIFIFHSWNQLELCVDMIFETTFNYFTLGDWKQAKEMERRAAGDELDCL
jgi:hypothetical protein